jgi:non-ribosomal peptide synthetase component E (peptide arylation enzyme)
MTTQAIESIVRGPFALPPIPETDLASFALRHSARLGDKPALIDAANGRTIAYGRLAPLVRRAAAGLARRGFRQGDVLALHRPARAVCRQRAAALRPAADPNRATAHQRHHDG